MSDRRLRAPDEKVLAINPARWQQGHDTGLSGLPFLAARNAAATCDRWSWVAGFIEGNAARLNRVAEATTKLDVNRQH